MNKKQVERILSGAGYLTDQSTIQTPEFRALLFSTVYGIDYHKDHIQFDTDDLLIKIKNYEYKVSSALIDSFTTTDNITLWAEKFNISKPHPVYPFRNIQAGDIVFKVDKTTKKIINNKWTVEKAGSRFIVLDKALTFNSKKEWLCYCDPNKFSSMVVDPLCPVLFFNYSAYTNKNTDVYLDMEQMFGIELVSPRVGAA